MPKLGRPPKFKNEEEIGILATEYLRECKENSRIPNKAGLRLKLGVNREMYGIYGKRFKNAIKEVEDQIQDAWVQILGTKGQVGSIFYLKNAFSEEFRDQADHNINFKQEKPLLSAIRGKKSSRLAIKTKVKSIDDRV